MITALDVARAVVATVDEHDYATVNDDRTRYYNSCYLLTPEDPTQPCCLVGTILREQFGESLEPMIEADFFGGPIRANVRTPGFPGFTLAGHFTDDALTLLQYVQTEADSQEMWGDIALIAKAGFPL